MSAVRISSFAAVLCGLFATLSTLQALPIKFLPWDHTVAARKLAFSDGKDVIELQDLHPDKRSKSQNWAGGEVPPMIVALDRTKDDGTPVTVPIKLASGIKSPLVLILPDPGNPSGLRSYVIEDNSGSFGWGTVRFINATGKELLVRQDKDVKKLPKTWQTTDISPGGNSRNLGIQMASPDDLSTVLYSAVWEHDPEIRKLVIIVPAAGTGSGALDLKIIPEDRRTVAVPAAPTEVQEP